MRRLLLVLSLSSCASLPIVDTAEETRLAGGPSRVLEILNRHQCAKCHTTDSVFGGPPGFLDPDAAQEPREVKLPTLASMERFRAAWLRKFLAAPFVVRPNLEERMIVHALKPWEIDALVTGWRAIPEPDVTTRPAATELARGAELFEAKQCGLCHLYGRRPFTVAEGWQFTKLPGMLPRALAPDLQHTRERLTPETIAAWIENPASVKPTSPMPKVQVTREEARAIAAWILFDEAPAAVAATSRP